MTHVPEISAINWLHFLALVSGSLCVSYISGTGFVWYQIPAPIRTLFYSKPECGVPRARHLNDHLWFIPFQLNFGYNTRYNYSAASAGWANSSSTLLSATFMLGAIFFFIPDVSLHVYGAKKPAPENGVDLCRRFLERVSCVLHANCVNSDTKSYTAHKIYHLFGSFLSTTASHVTW